MIADNSPSWPEDMAKIAVATGYEADTMLGMMGEHIKGQLQGSIRDLMEPALSPVTIAKKGFDKPLIWHGVMLNSVDYDVTDGV